MTHENLLFSMTLFNAVRYSLHRDVTRKEI